MSCSFSSLELCSGSGTELSEHEAGKSSPARAGEHSTAKSVHSDKVYHADRNHHSEAGLSCLDRRRWPYQDGTVAVAAWIRPKSHCRRQLLYADCVERFAVITSSVIVCIFPVLPSHLGVERYLVPFDQGTDGMAILAMVNHASLPRSLLDSPSLHQDQ